MVKPVRRASRSTVDHIVERGGGGGVDPDEATPINRSNIVKLGNLVVPEINASSYCKGLCPTFKFAKILCKSIFDEWNKEGKIN